MRKTGTVSLWLLKFAVILAVINPLFSIWMATESSLLFGLVAWLAGGLVIVGVGLAGLWGGAGMGEPMRRAPRRTEQVSPAGRGHSVAL